VQRKKEDARKRLLSAVAKRRSAKKLPNARRKNEKQLSHRRKNKNYKRNERRMLERKRNEGLQSRGPRNRQNRKLTFRHCAVALPP